MTATEVAPPSTGNGTAGPSRFRGGPAAVASAALGIAAFGFALAPRGQVIAAGLSLVAVCFAVAALHGSRRHRRPGRELAAAGIALAFLATIGTMAAQAAFGSILERAPAAAPAEAGPDVSPVTKDVLSDELDVAIHNWTVGLDESGISAASLAVTVTNKTRATRSFDLKLEALNAKGKRITVDSAYVPHLKAGQSANVSVFNIVNPVLAPALKKADVRVTEAVSY